MSAWLLSATTSKIHSKLARSSIRICLDLSLSRESSFPVNLDDEKRTASGDGEVDVNRATGTVKSAKRNSNVMAVSPSCPENLHYVLLPMRQ